MNNIELKRMQDRYGYPLRGDREIYVDGVLWGYVNSISRGIWGRTYRFQELGNHLVTDAEGRAVEVESSSKYNPNADKRPLDARLIDKIGEIIDLGQFEHPDVVRRKEEELREKMRKEQERVRRAERARREQIATEIATEYLPPYLRENLINAIVEALEAETKRHFL